MLLIDKIQALSLKDKRALVKTIRSIIAEDVKEQKVLKVFSKVAKENAKKAKIEAQIKAAQDKLAKLTAKLGV
jgi:type II secretory pathway predicted ATPase ExeA